MTIKNQVKFGLAVAGSLAVTALVSYSSPALAQDDQSRPLESGTVVTALPADFAWQPDAGAITAAGPMAGGVDADAAMMGGGCGLKGELALTDDQYEKMYNLRNDFLDRVGPKMVEAHALERHLRDVLTSPTIDTKKAGDIKSKLAAAKSDLAEAKADMEIQMAQILTADQRKHVRLAMAKCPMIGGWGHRPMMHHPHGGWGGRGHHGHDGHEHGPNHGPEHGPEAK